MTTYTVNKYIAKPANGGFPNAWDVPVNSDWDIIDKAFGSEVTKTLVGNTATVTITQAQNQRILLTGVLTAAGTVTIPYQDGSVITAVGGMWVVNNETTGVDGSGAAWPVTVKTVVAGSVGVVVDRGKRSLVYSDGTDVLFADDRASGGGATGGGDNAIFFENDLAVTADYSIPATKNAMTAGPISVDAGITVTIPATSTWTIV